MSGHQEACTILSLLFLSWTGLDWTAARLHGSCVLLGRVYVCVRRANRSFVVASMLLLASAAQTTFPLSTSSALPACLPTRLTATAFVLCLLEYYCDHCSLQGASSLRSRAHIRQKSSPTTPSATPPWSLVPFRLLISIEIALDFRAE